MANSPETTFHSLEHCMLQNGRELPLIVRVRKGFCGEAVNQLVQPGEVLIIYKVKRNRKILAKDNRGRELCLPTTCNWNVEITTENSEFDKLSDVPSPYFRVLQDIPSFGCVAGDILLCTSELPHQSKANTLRCRLLSSRQRVYITFPANLKGKFQALLNYRLLSLDQVLHELSLPVNAARLVPNGHPTNSSQQLTQALRTLGNVQIEREIEEETVFAILPNSQNCVVMFPSTLELRVTQFMTQREFMCRCGPQFQQLVTAIETDKSLQNTLHADRVCFTNEQVTCYSLDALQFPPFCFEKIERTESTESVVVMKKQRELLTEEQIADASIQVETDTLSSKGIRSWINTEDKAPPLPPKMTLKVETYQISSQKEQVHNIESSQESETPSEMSGKQEVENVHRGESLVIRRAMNGKSKIEAARSFRSLPRERRSTRMQYADANFSEIKKDVFTASALQRDVNANSAVSSGVDSTVVRRATLKSNFQSKQPSFHVPYNPQGQDLSIVSTRNITRRTKSNAHTTSKDSAFRKGRPPQEEKSGNRRKQSDNFDTNTGTNSEAHRKEVNMSECSESSLEKNVRAEDGEEGDSREFSDVNIQDEQDQGPTPKEQPSSDTTETTTAECSRQKEGNAEARAENIYVNADNVKKGLFHSLTRKPRWFRQDTSKPGKKEKELVKKERTEAMRIPQRHAASCEDLLFSSPKEDDFEWLGNIKTYLETKERLTKALVKINHLEKLTSKPSDSEDKVPRNTMNLPGSSDSSEDEETEIILCKANSRRSAHNLGESSTSSESPDLGYEFMLPGCGPQLDNVSFESHRNEHCARRDTEGVEMDVEFCHKACFCPRNRDLKMSVLSESAAKHELKRAILEMEWSDEEWEALTKIVARKMSHRKRPNVPYVNMQPFGSPPVDQSVVDGSGISAGNNEKSMPPYVNLDQKHGIDDQRAKEAFLDDMQRLAHRSHGKRPVPTPRGGGLSM